MLTKQQIIDSDDRPTLDLEIPEWGGSVCIRTISGTQRDGFEASLIDKNGDATKLHNVRAKFAALVLCDDKGDPLFSEGQAAQLGNKSAKALTRIWEKGREFNKMESLDDAEKNSEAAQSGNSGSSSPSQ